MISRDEAAEAAGQGLRQVPVHADALFAPWTDASIGAPVMVRTVQGVPSYWLAPVMIQGRVAGFVRVNAEGKVVAFGAYYRDPAQIATGPTTVTRMDADAAARLAAISVSSARGETATAPMYVHDGPPGREAWMIVVSRQGRPIRWIFVTPGGLYERPAGTVRDTGVE